MDNKQLVQRAIDILEPIEKEKWIVGTDGSADKFCAVLHLIRNKHESVYALNSLALQKKGVLITSVNDGEWLDKYPQSTPKARVMALLNDLLAS